MKVSAETARRLILWKQAFSNHPDPDKPHILDTIKRLGCIQMDTINVVERSHYLTLWSRLGFYCKEHLDQLLYPDRKVFEYWAHAASIIPVENYGFYINTMNEYRKSLKLVAERWLGEKANLIDQVLERIRREGPMSSSDFEHKEQRKGKKSGWWGLEASEDRS